MARSAVRSMSAPPELIGAPAIRRTLAEALRSAEAHLTASGVASPRVDAELLAAHLLRTQRVGLWQYLQQPVPTGFDDLVARRAERIPLQHLTGVSYFRTTELAVGPGVFSPRPETEVVAGHAIDVLSSMQRDVKGRQPLVVDLCSGSGAIAAAISVEVPGVEVHAVERDPAAGPWLLHNARSHGFTAHLDDVDGCLPELTGQIEVVVANPPYIPEGSIPRDPEVARFDPPAALYSGVDGLEHMRMIERNAARLLKRGGCVAVEHGDLQGKLAPEIFAGTNKWSDVADNVDLAGRDRYVTARRSDV